MTFLINRILILRSNALGDTVYATSILEGLKLQYPNAAIDWIGTNLSKGLFKFDPRISHVFGLNHRKIPLFFSSEKRFIVSHSKKNPYDLFINLNQGKQFHSLAKEIVATQKLGEPYTSLKDAPSGLHAGEKLKFFYKAILSTENFDQSYPTLYSNPEIDVHTKFDLPAHYIVFNPSNSHNQKSGINHRAWPISHWQTLLNTLNTKIPIVIIANKGEESYFEPMRPFPSRNIFDLIGKTTLDELIAIVQNAQLLVTTDTGPAHIASAVNTPVICLVGPTPAHRTGPLKTPYNHVLILSKNLECSPCYRTERIKTCKENRCMIEITPSEVESHVVALLNSTDQSVIIRD